VMVILGKISLPFLINMAPKFITFFKISISMVPNQHSTMIQSISLLKANPDATKMLQLLQ